MTGNEKNSPIVRAIAIAEAGTTGEIRVHLSRRWFERDPFGRAQRLFQDFGMARTTHHNAVLLYVNVRRKKFAIVGDSGIHASVGQKYWEDLAQALKRKLQAGGSVEAAVANAVDEIGKTLRKFFPSDLEHSDELPNEVSED